MMLGTMWTKDYSWLSLGIGPKDDKVAVMISSLKSLNCIFLV